MAQLRRASFPSDALRIRPVVNLDILVTAMEQLLVIAGANVR